MAQMAVVSMEVKLAAVLARVASGERVDVTAVCTRLGISRTTFYKYRDRFAAGGVEGLLPRSRRPHSCPGQTPPEVEEHIVRLREQLAEDGWDNGAVSIVLAWRDAGVRPPSVSTVHRVLRRRGLVVDAPRKRPRSSWRRFEFECSNDCWQIDAFEWALAGGGSAAVVQIVDDHSRLEVDSLAAAAETGPAAWACWLRAVQRHGVPAMVLSDNGAAFSGARRGWTAAFERNVRALGTRTVTSTPGHPQTCGKDERAHATLQRWLRARPRAATLADLQAQLDSYRELFNARRRHQGIGGQLPARRYADDRRAGPAAVGATAGPDPGSAAVATPPEVAATAARSTPVQPGPVRVTHPVVSATGVVRVNGHDIGLGVGWHGRRTTCLRSTDHVAVFIGAQLIRELTLDRTRRYQPSGARPGPPPHVRNDAPARSAPRAGGVNVERPQRSEDERR